MNNLQFTEWTDFRKCANEPSHLRRMTSLGNESFTPLSPETQVSGISDIQLIETTSDTKRKLVDLRHLKKDFTGVK